MTQSDFWLKLEYRVCREFAGLSDKNLRGIWCDGFDAWTFYPHEKGARIVGRAWIGHDGQGLWEFELIARERIEAWEDVNWDQLLPGEDVTGWMSLDLERKVLKMDPGAAYPDKDPSP